MSVTILIIESLTEITPNRNVLIVTHSKHKLKIQSCLCFSVVGALRWKSVAESFTQWKCFIFLAAVVCRVLEQAVDLWVSYVTCSKTYFRRNRENNRKAVRPECLWHCDQHIRWLLFCSEVFGVNRNRHEFMFRLPIVSPYQLLYSCACHSEQTDNTSLPDENIKRKTFCLSTST